MKGKNLRSHNPTISNLIKCFVLLFFYSSLSQAQIAVGVRVQCTQDLNVHATAGTSGSLVTTEASGSRGTVTLGPQSGSGYTWWYISWSDGDIGWSVQDYLQLITPVSVTTQPTNQIATVGGTATFSVSVSGTPPFSYFWYKNGAFQSNTTNISSTTNAYTTPTLTAGDDGNNYYCLITNGTNFYEVQSNTVNLRMIPVAPTLSSPGNSSTGQAIGFTFTWNASSGATSYGLQVSTDPNFGSYVLNTTGITNTAYGINNLSYSTTYYWRVNATNAGGTSAYSSVSSFTTVPAPPSAPSLSSPANGSTNVPTSTTLYWNTPSGVVA